ncbi:MAG: CoA transferase [Deltaproteobacteria bacterium]|nr:CoA transferase [Deltaproteobacteria bacterium]
MEQIRLKSPLEGIKIADFSWSVVGPTITTFLSYYGAEVIKVESIHSPEITRHSAPFKNDVVGIDRSFVFSSLNTNKYSIRLNLKHPRGHEIALKLAGWADIVVQSATEKTLKNLGITHDDLRKVNGDVITLNTTNQGETGPYANQPGYGDSVVALAGFPEVTGWPDREPSLPPGAYTDLVTPWFGCLAILAALEYRRKTGNGQHIDIAQLETGLQMLRPAALMHSANNEIMQRAGNRSFAKAPHGVYRCRGEDRWCSIAVSSETEWMALCRVISNPDISNNSMFLSMSSRKKNEDELDRLIESWTINFSPEEVMARLQKEGVAAGVVKNIKDLHEDPQLMHRQHFRTIKHPELEEYRIEMPPVRLSENNIEIRRHAPCLGEHTSFVCCELLGMTDKEFVQLHSEGVFE